MVGFNLFLKKISCSWCHKTYLWGKIPVSTYKTPHKTHQGLCPACSRALVQEMDRCHATSETPIA
jgi:hypothetical protein